MSGTTRAAPGDAPVGFRLDLDAHLELLRKAEAYERAAAEAPHLAGFAAALRELAGSLIARPDAHRERQAA